MSGGSQHNPNGRQAQLAPGWSPLQLQMASYLSRAHHPERGVTWHTPTPPPHLYHVPQPSPPDPLQLSLQAMKAGNAGVYRHTGTPPDLFRHTPTPPDKHRRHTPSPGDPKSSAVLNPVDIYSQLGGVRDKLRPDDMLYARGGVDLSVSRPLAAAHNGAPLALSVRDAPTINSLIARSHRPTRVDQLLERLPHSPLPSVIVRPTTEIVRPAPDIVRPVTDIPRPDNDSDSQETPGKRRRKPDKVVRHPRLDLDLPVEQQVKQPVEQQIEQHIEQPVEQQIDNLEPENLASDLAQNGQHHSPRKRRSPSAETLDDIAAMVAAPAPEPLEEPAAKFVEVENQLEQMFAGIEEPAQAEPSKRGKGKKRRKSTPKKEAPIQTEEVTPKKRGRRKKSEATVKAGPKDAYDSGSNASSGKSRGPYIQIRGPRDSPSVSVMNAEEEPERPKPADFRTRNRGLLCSTLNTRYDATTADETWICVLCERGPHAGARAREPGPPLGDLFGPYSVSADCEEFLALNEEERSRWKGENGLIEVWFHESCAVWAPGVLVAGARAWGLSPGVWRARGAKCGGCAKLGAGLACGARGCAARAHVGCARASGWKLQEEQFLAWCKLHT